MRTSRAGASESVGLANQHHALHFYTSFGICVEERGVTVKEKSDLPQGTLDLLILKVVALGPVHGYAIAQRLQQVSRDVVQVPQGSLYPGTRRRRGARRNSTS
jgi:hypothetical protein